MVNMQKYNTAFIETFQVKEEDLENIIYQSIKAWDSVGHMALIATLEDTFDIMMDTDDIIDFNSYVKGKEIIAKYGVDL